MRSFQQFLLEKEEYANDLAKYIDTIVSVNGIFQNLSVSVQEKDGGSLTSGIRYDVRMKFEYRLNTYIVNLIILPDTTSVDLEKDERGFTNISRITIWNIEEHKRGITNPNLIPAPEEDRQDLPQTMKAIKSAIDGYNRGKDEEVTPPPYIPSSTRDTVYA